MARKPKQKKQVDTLIHDEATRKNNPSLSTSRWWMSRPSSQIEVRYARGGNGLEEEKQSRNRGLDPQLV